MFPTRDIFNKIQSDPAMHCNVVIAAPSKPRGLMGHGNLEMKLQSDKMTLCHATLPPPYPPPPPPPGMFFHLGGGGGGGKVAYFLALIMF